MDSTQVHVMRARPSRRIRACKQCRAAKVKCSGSRPCERCTRRSDTCIFPADEAHVSVPERYLRDLQREIAQHRRSTATVPTLRPGWPSSLSAADTNISVMTPTSFDARPEATSSARPAEMEPPPFPTFAPAVTQPTPALPLNASQTAEGRLTTALRNEDESDISAGVYNPLVTSDVAYVRGSDDHRLLFLGHTSTWSFCRRAFKLLEDAACSPDARRAPLNLDGAAFRLQWLRKSEVDATDLLRLPPVDHALFLFNTVKFRLGELFSVVDEDRFLRTFHAFHKAPLETAQSHVLWFVEYLMVIAFGKAFTCYPDQPSAAPVGSEFAARALSLLPDVAFLQDERPAILAIEVFVLVALYFQSIDMRSPAYQYIGQALRLSLHDGLHRELSDDVMDSNLVSRLSSAWWTVYILDQEFTAGLGCPSAVPLSSITTPVPDARSSSLSAKALTLRTRLSRLVSSACSTIYSLDEGLNSDFIHNITLCLHGLADVSREIDEVIAAFGASKGEIPQMFYNIMLSHHHCIVLATRPLVIWLLIRSVAPNNSNAVVLNGPVERLLEKSVQSATKTLLMLLSLLDRDMLETFLPFPLEYAFSSAVLLSILRTLLPTYVQDPRWRGAVSALLGEMIRRGNVVAVLRKAELEHLERLLEPHQRLGPSLTLQRESELQQSLPETVGTQPPSRSRNFERDENEPGTSWDETCSTFGFFSTAADDILALAEQLQHEDFSSTFLYQ